MKKSFFYTTVVFAGLLLLTFWAMDMAQDWSGTAAAFENGFNKGVK